MLGPGSGNILEYMIGIDAWNQPGTFVSPPRKIQSFINTSSNGSTKTPDQMETLTAEDFFYNESMLPLLKNWELTKTVLNVYSSTLIEILQNSSPTISGCGNYDNDINEFLKSIDLTANIIDNLKEDLYYGQRAFVIDYDKKRIYDLKDSRNMVVIKKLGDTYRYADSIEAVIDKLDKTKIYTANKVGYIGFDVRKVASRCTGKYIQDSVFSKKIEDITYHRGQSVLASGLYLIFEHMLKSLLRLLLTLKNSTRPDLIQVTINKEKTSEVNITEAVSAIESLLNQGEYSFDIRSNNIINIVQTLYNSIVNSVKVLPVINNISGMDLVQQPPIGDRIDKLTQEIQESKNNALMNLAIPEDIIGTGSNKWEILSRSTRFNTRMNDLLIQIGNTYKIVAFNYIRTRGGVVKLGDIKLNLDSSSYLTNSNFAGRTTLLSEKLTKFKEIMQIAQDLEDSVTVNKKRMRDYIRNNLQSTDKDLFDMLKTEKEIADGLENTAPEAGMGDQMGNDTGGML